MFLYAVTVRTVCIYFSPCEANDIELQYYFSLSLPRSLSLSQGPCVDGVIMHSWLVTVMLLASAANNSGGQGAKGTWGGGSVPVGMYMFSPQVHKCPSQTTHVHNLTYTAFKIEDSAQTVEDFGRVLSRKEPVRLY